MYEFMNSISTISLIEITGVLIYFASVYFAIKINKLTWLTGIVSCALFCYLYIEGQTYANAGLQVFFIILSIIGWVRWNKKDTDNITFSSNNKYLVFFISTAIIYFGGGIIKHYFREPYPYLDSAIFVWSVVGVILMALKKIETWVYWILVNITSMILYILIGYNFIAFQDAIFIIMNAFGIKQWVKLWKEQNLLKD